MLIRFFVEAKEKKEALKLVEGNLAFFEKTLKIERINEVSQYWKIKNTFLVEMLVTPQRNVFQLKCFLEFFSDSWLEFGYPVDEFLASKNNNNCTYMKDKFVLIDIFTA